MRGFKEYIKIAIKNLTTRPIRSWLTIIAIIIGVFLIMTLMSLSEGIKSAVLQELKKTGSDVIIVMPGEITNMMTTMVGGIELTKDDLDAIKKTKGVDTIAPLTYAGEVVKFEGEKKPLAITGIPWEETRNMLEKEMGWEIGDGRWPIPGKREIIIGSKVTEDVFPKIRVGSNIFIKGKQFEVVGILKSMGNKIDDSSIYMDLKIFRDTTGQREGAKVAFVKVKFGYLPDNVISSIKENLEKNSKRKRGQDENLSSYTVLNSEKATEIISNIMNLLEIMVIAFASIAIIVGGIGIMNTMYTSVYERIREIGIMKAIGATRKTIIFIFLTESGIFGLMGGIGGIIFGLGFAKAIEFYFQSHSVFLFKAAVTPRLIIFGLVFSFLIGCLAGFLPARSASRLNPVDALRYE